MGPTTGLFLSPEAAGRGEGQPLRPDAGRQQQLHATEGRRQTAGLYYGREIGTVGTVVTVTAGVGT